MKNLNEYVLNEPEKSDFNLFFINIVRSGALVHSGLVKNRTELEWKMDSILIEAIQKELSEKTDTVDHVHATWGYFFDPDNQMPYEKKYAPPFSGEFIRYKGIGDKKPKRHSTEPWKYLGKDWVVFVHEEENDSAYREAMIAHEVRQKELLEEFKVTLFQEAGLEKHPKREKIWEKAVSKFGTDHPDRLAKIQAFVGDVAELA